MKALRFSAFTGVDGLSLETVHNPLRASSEVLIEVCAASVNPSDVKNVQGHMHGTTLPRTPGRDFSGIVVDGPTELVGKHVWGAGGEIGFTRDGTHAEYVVLPANGVAIMPESLSFAEAAAAGVAFVTAWSGVHDVIGLEAGETIVVTGAMGSVGSAVVQLARWMGATTIGVVRNLQAPEKERTIVPDFFVAADQDDLAASLRSLAPSGKIDAVFDTVGEPLFATLIDALSAAGRYAIIANTGQKFAQIELIPFYRKRLHLAGVDSRAIDAIQAAVFLQRLRSGFESGALNAPNVDEVVGLHQAIDAYRRLFEGASRKIVIDPRIDHA